VLVIPIYEAGVNTNETGSCVRVLTTHEFNTSKSQKISAGPKLHYIQTNDQSSLTLPVRQKLTDFYMARVVGVSQYSGRFDPEDKFGLKFPLRIVDHISPDEEKEAWGPFLRGLGVSYEFCLKPGSELLLDAILNEDVDAVKSVLATSKTIDPNWTASNLYTGAIVNSDYGNIDYARAALAIDNATKRRAIATALAKARINFNRAYEAHYGWNLAHIYCHHANPEVLRLAIELGADPHARDTTTRHRTPHAVALERLEKETFTSTIKDLKTCASIVK